MQKLLKHTHVLLKNLPVVAKFPVLIPIGGIFQPFLGTHMQMKPWPCQITGFCLWLLKICIICIKMGKHQSRRVLLGGGES